jgi:hypothetical protein
MKRLIARVSRGVPPALAAAVAVSMSAGVSPASTDSLHPASHTPLTTRGFAAALKARPVAPLGGPVWSTNNVNKVELPGPCKLTPTTIHAHAVGGVHFDLACKDALVGRRQLRRISLDLYLDNRRLGFASIHPLIETPSPFGGSQVSRFDELLAHGEISFIGFGSRCCELNEKTVTARLAVPLPRELAGRTLRIEVGTEDLDLREELVPNAGAIHVTR